MKVRGLDGREYNIRLDGKKVYENSTRKRSSGHLAARALFKELYGTTPVLEEVVLPGSGNLSADFFLPREKKIIEIHGVQHYRYCPFFHGTVAGFMKAKANDRKKKEWCELNDIQYIELPDTESEEEWRARLC